VPTNLPPVNTTTTTVRATTTTTTIPTTTQVNETLKLSIITPDSPAIFNVSDPDTLKIQNVILAVNKNVTNVTIMVKEASHPSGAPNVTNYETGIIFKYLDISATNVTGDDISNVTINFQVEKNWINSTSIDIGTIALYRYFNSTWNKLLTSKLNETSNLITFQAVSPGLSVFVIAGQKTGGWDIFKMLNIFPGIPSWAIIAAIVAAVAIVLAYFFWPVKEVKTQTVYMPKDEKQEEDVISKLKEKWEKVAKKK
jgi:PGF-pre-PGF domain-containing protein